MICKFSVTVLSFLLLCSSFIIGQTIVRGKITFQSSGSIPALGVEINASGAQHAVYSDDDGAFKLIFENKEPGDDIDLIVGTTDKDDIELELINGKDLANANIPLSDSYKIRIVVAKKGERNQKARKFYNILTTDIERTYNQKLSAIEKQLLEQESDKQELLQKRKELDRQRIEALQKAELQAAYIASIDLDQSSKIIKEAIEKLEKDEDVEGALKVLDMDRLEKVYQNARAKQLKARREKLSIIESYLLRIDLLAKKLEFREMAESYENVFQIIETIDYPLVRLALILENAGTNYINLQMFDHAADCFRKELQILTDTVGSHDRLLSSGFYGLAATFYLKNEMDSAKKYQKRAILTLVDYSDSEQGVLINDLFSMHTKLPENAIDIKNPEYCIEISNRVLSETEKGELYFYSAVFDFGTEQFESALKKLKKATRSCKNLEGPDYFHLIGIANIRIGNFKAAEKAMRKYEKCAPMHARLFRDWAVYFASVNDIDSAFENLDKSVDLGLRDKVLLIQESKFEILKDDHRFIEILKSLHE